MTATERARARRKRRLIIAAAFVATACAPPPTAAPPEPKPMTPAALTERDVIKLRSLDPSPRPKPRHRPARIGWALTIRRGDPTPAQLARLRWCESGRDGSWRVDSPSRARGAYQFLIGTWQSVGGRGDPAAAPLDEQTYRTVLLYRRDGWRPWLASSGCTGLV